VALHAHEWGDPAAPPVVCLHGVTGHARRFRRLSEERLAPRFHVRALDLRGHGHSTWEEPWDLDTHVADILGTVTERASWIGHSLGGRLVIEVTARRPELVERAVLLDPAIWIPPEYAAQNAALEGADKTYASVEEAVRKWAGLFHTPREILDEEMSEHLVEQNGRFRYRYSQAAAAAAHLDLATQPPRFDLLRVPTLLVVGARAKIVSAGEAELYRRALGDLLQLVVVPGGHSVLWDAFDETADAIESFLSA
jgi:lipase